jgi:hypothetical protein
MVTGLPVQLPAGWVQVDAPGEVRSAALPEEDGAYPAAVVTITPAAEAGRDELQRVLDQMRATLPVDLLVLDAGPARCRRGTPAHRVLVAHTHVGRGLTTELWLVGGARPAVLCAAVDTARYAALGPVVQRMLRSYGPPA